MKKGRATKDRSGSSRDSSEAEDAEKSSKSKQKRGSKKGSKTKGLASTLGCRAVPKKSAIAKPISKPPKKSVSENDSDSDFGDFSLPKLTAKAKQVRLKGLVRPPIASLAA